MRIQEACRQAGVTRKAALVAMEQGLLSPAREENGYRSFSPADVERLRRIATLRGLGLTGAEIGQVLTDAPEALNRAAVACRLRRTQEAERQQALEQLALDGDWQAAERTLNRLRAQMTLGERLMDAFPGFFGCYVAMHFSAFLSAPLETAGQQQALTEALDFLDDMELPEPSPAVREMLTEASAFYTPEHCQQVTAQLRAAASAPDNYVAQHREELQGWATAREQIAHDPAFQVLRETQTYMRQLVDASGYTEHFLPLMRRISPDYDAYCRALEAAEPAFLRAVQPLTETR